MTPRALALDYDGTLARDGIVDDATLAALVRARDAGCALVLVSGRELPSLTATFRRTDVFARLVLENGALLCTPATGEARALAGAPPAAFVERLRERRVEPLSVGRVVVATRRPHEATMRETIAEMRLLVDVVLNKDSVMALPAGVDKRTGLLAALEELGIAAADVAAFGDAENDEPLFDAAGYRVAMANAVPALKARADLVTRASHGAGVAEAIDRLLPRR